MAIDENIRDLKLSARVVASGDTGVGSVGGWGEIEKVGTSCNPITIYLEFRHMTNMNEDVIIVYSLY